MKFCMEEDYAYIISPFGLGDTFILCMLKDAIEDRYGVTVKYVIKPSHVAILEMFGYEYVIGEYLTEELYDIAQNNKIIKAGRLYVAHPHFCAKNIENAFFEHKIDFLQMYLCTLGLDNGEKLTPKIDYPDVSNELIRKIYPLKVEDVILFAPEMTSCASLQDRPPMEWLKTYEAFEDKTRIVVNSRNKNCPGYQGRYVDLTLSELISLAVNCNKVISVRSGLCDLIYPKVKKMIILYANVDVWMNYSLKDLFKSICLNENVKEYCISYSHELNRRGYKNCAVYGMGINGRRLIHTLQREGFQVKYAIDRNAETITTDMVPVIAPTVTLPDTDCIISTVTNGFDQIKENLQKQERKIPIINYWDMKYKSNVQNQMIRELR